MRDLHCGALDSIKIDATFRELGFMCLLKKHTTKAENQFSTRGE
jgi:hypothetical protein